MAALAVMAMAPTLAGCDTFFDFDAVVTACDTGQPLEGVEVVTHLDDGHGEPDHHAVTDADGRVRIHLNEPDGVVVTVTMTKAGYETWSRQYRGEPGSGHDVCLTPAAP
jgi:hypothetical protein